MLDTARERGQYYNKAHFNDPHLTQNNEKRHKEKGFIPWIMPKIGGFSDE